MPQPALDALLAEPAGDAVRRALWLDALDRRLQSCLPPGLAAQGRLANVDGDTLVYLVDSPVWNARLRMASPGLVDAARSVGLPVSQLVVRTASGPLRHAARAFAAGTPAQRTGMSTFAGETLRKALASLDASVGGKAEQDDLGPDASGATPGPSRTGHPTGAKGPGS